MPKVLRFTLKLAVWLAVAASVGFAVWLTTSESEAQIQPAAPPQGNLNGSLYASGYGGWSVPPGNAGTNSWSNGSFCTANYGGTTFAAFTAGTPIRINDLINPTAYSETVTVTAVDQTSNSCSIQTTTPLYQHTDYTLGSATAGLQEAINANLGSQVAMTIHLTADWFRLGGTLSMVTTTAQGGTNIGIVDETKTPTVWYAWGGSHYASVGGAGGSPTGPATGVLGCDYPAPCFNTSPEALPNGWTATQQATTDDTDAVSNDAFVQAVVAANELVACMGVTPWSSTQQYYGGQFACYQQVLWTSVGSSLNQAPSNTSDYWQKTIGGVTSILGGQYYCGGATLTGGQPAPCFVDDSGEVIDYQQTIGNNNYGWGADNNGTSNNYWSIGLFLVNSGSVTHPRNFTLNWAANGWGADEWHQAADNFFCWTGGDSNAACALGLSLDNSLSSTIDVGTSKGDFSGNLKLNNLTVNSCTGCSASGNTTSSAMTPGTVPVATAAHAVGNSLYTDLDNTGWYNGTYFGVGDNPYQPLIAFTGDLLQVNGPNTAYQPLTLGGGHAGSLNVIVTPNVTAPTVTNVNVPAGSTTISYVCSGTDFDGNLIPGTTTTISTGAASWSSPNGYNVVCPWVSGVNTFQIYRTAGGTDQGLLASGVGPGLAFLDYDGASSGGTPPGSSQSNPHISVAGTGTPCVTMGASGSQVSICSGTGAPTSTCGTSPTGIGSLWMRTDGTTASTALYSCGEISSTPTWSAVTIP